MYNFLRFLIKISHKQTVYVNGLFTVTVNPTLLSCLLKLRAFFPPINLLSYLPMVLLLRRRIYFSSSDLLYPEQAKVKQ